jgi:hypothetical protein
VVASLPPPAVPGYPQQYQLQSGTLPKLQVQPQLADRPSNQAGAAIAGAGTSGDHLAGSRRVSGTATGSPLAHASSQEISMHTALHGAHGGSDACLPRLNEPGAALQDAKLAGMPGSGAYATSNVSLVTTAATKATNSAAAAADPSSEQASASARVQPQVPDASVTPAAPAVAHGSSAAVLQQAGASGKEGATKEGSPAGQPKRWGWWWWWGGGGQDCFWSGGRGRGGGGRGASSAVIGHLCKSNRQERGHMGAWDGCCGGQWLVDELSLRASTGNRDGVLLVNSRAVLGRSGKVHDW